MDADSDQSVILEILGYNEDVSDSNCGQFYWEDNAQCNDAEGQHNAVHLTSHDISADVEVCSEPTAAVSSNDTAPSCWLISGVQHVAKFKERARNILAVHIAVLRMPHVGTDLVIHFNQPLELSIDSSSASVACADAGGHEQDGVGRGSAAVQQIMRTLKVHDWGLFSAPSEEDELDS